MFTRPVIEPGGAGGTGARHCFLHCILRDRAETVQIMATPSAEHRIATVILRLAGEMKAGEIKKITHRRQDIAEMAGLSLETTIRGIRKLAKNGHLKIIGGRIFVETTENLRVLVH